MSIICTICARGNSKGLKNKNILKINNEPLIAITIKQAKKAKIFDKIVVSSESKKILKICEKLNVDLLLRPKNLSNDKIGKIDVVKHTVLEIEKKKKYKFDYVCDLDVTSPLRNISDIKKSFFLLKKNKNCSNLISVCESKKNPYFNMVEIKNNLVKTSKFKKRFLTRQSSPKVFDLNASINLWRRKSLFSLKSILNSKTIVYQMPQERSFDIDSKLDFFIVKNLFRYKKKS